MTSDKKDVYGLSGLVNPSYAIPQAPQVERTFISNAPKEPEEPEETAESLLQKRLAAIEKNVGVPIFSQSSVDVAPDRASREEQQFDGFESRNGAADDDQAPAREYARPANTQRTDAPPESQTPAPTRILSNEGLHHTQEEMKRERLTSALSALSIGTDGFLEADHEQDRKLMMIEEIEDLMNLFSLDGEQLPHIRVPTHEDSIETIQGTLKILRRHNDRKRYGNLADDCIMLAATSLETLCDGQREWMGFKPNLVGWGNHVRSKLRRMHHDTSQIASSLMNNYNIGPGLRLVLELVPNLVMYARSKSANAAAQEPEQNEAAFADAVGNLRKK